MFKFCGGFIVGAIVAILVMAFVEADLKRTTIETKEEMRLELLDEVRDTMDDASRICAPNTYTAECKEALDVWYAATVYNYKRASEIEKELTELRK